MALRSARSAGHAFMRPQSHIVSISLLSGKDWSKVISLQGTNAHGIIFELDREQANLLRAHVLHRMRRQRLYPRDHGWAGGRRRGAGVEQDFAVAVTADKIARAKRVNHAWPAVSVNRHDLPGGDADNQNAHSRILDHQFVILGRRRQSIKGIRPGPAWSIRVSDVLVHFLLPAVDRPSEYPRVPDSAPRRKNSGSPPGPTEPLGRPRIWDTIRLYLCPVGRFAAKSPMYTAPVTGQRVTDGIIFGFAFGLIRRRLMHRRWVGVHEPREIVRSWK